MLSIQQAGKVGVQALISCDELIAEGESGHESSLLQPKNSTEAPWEEDAFNGCKCDESLPKTAIWVDPLEGPLGFGADAGDRVDGL